MKRPLSALLPLLLIPLRVAAAQPKRTPAVAPAPAELPAVLRAKRPAGGEWYGLYILGKKAGFAFSELRPSEWNGQKVVLERSDVTLRAAIEGKPMERSIREERYYEPKDGRRLLGFRVVKSGDGGEETLVGAVRELQHTRV